MLLLYTTLKIKIQMLNDLRNIPVILNQGFLSFFSSDQLWMDQGRIM